VDHDPSLKEILDLPVEDFVAVNDSPEHIELGDGYL
jgi:hypothetical protein